jgi:hypothetical protein
MAYEHFDDAQSIRVCAGCIGDPVLKEEVHSNGTTCACVYCESTAPAVSLEWLADRIHQVINTQFYLTSSEPEGLGFSREDDATWTREGQPVTEVIAELAAIGEGLAEDVRLYLSDLYGHGAVKDGGEDPYADDAQYEDRGPDDQNLRDTWASFRQQILRRSRYFSTYAQVDLDNIFGDLDALRTHEGASAVQTVNPSSLDHHVFRARVAFSQTELEEILAKPAEGLGAPPFRLARAGRMNPAGISVFYGARDADTCVAEIRAPVGSRVVIGRFEFIRPVRLLDLDALDQVYVEGSRFDSEYPERRARAAFLGRLVSDINRPVMPSDEGFEYLPTQIVAEYLATRAKLDGILFRSSQTGGDGKNLVLFNHASVAEPDNAKPGTTYDVFMDYGSEDDHTGIISVFEKEPPDTTTPAKSASSYLQGRDPEAPWLAAHKPTLRLDNRTVRVLEVTGVSYKVIERYVLRSRVKQRRAP